MLELPRELKQLNEMRHKRREWALGHYPVTEKGLLDRFNPYSEVPPQTSAAENDHSKIEPKYFEPAAVKLPSPPQMDPLVNQETTCPSGVTSVSPVDENASSKPQSQFPALASASDLIKEKSADLSRSTDVIKGCKEAQIIMMGRGRPFGKEQESVSVLPSMGRGFLLQFPPPQTSRQSASNIRASDELPQVPGRH